MIDVHSILTGMVVGVIALIVLTVVIDRFNDPKD